MDARDRDPTGDELRARIGALENQSAVDRAVIAQLEADGLVDRNQIANLQTALVTCRRIGAAIGILMASYKISEEQAFGQLQKASQAGHTKLHDVAEAVLRTGTISDA